MPREEPQIQQTANSRQQTANSKQQTAQQTADSRKALSGFSAALPPTVR
jgi:hypothetical protein